MVVETTVRGLLAGDFLLGSRQTVIWASACVYGAPVAGRGEKYREVKVVTRKGVERRCRWNPSTTMRVERTEV